MNLQKVSTQTHQRGSPTRGRKFINTYVLKLCRRASQHLSGDLPIVCHSEEFRRCGTTKNLEILRPAQSGTQDDSSSLRGVYPACPERILGEPVEGSDLS
jgi:hypothetical protein